MDLLHIKDDKFWDKINSKHGDKGGVYKLIAVRNEQRVKVDRFLDQDENGILYIGKGISFIDRVISLKKSISPDYNGTGHICGRRYKGNPNIALKFPCDILFIELTQTDKPEELEKQLLKDYELKFGEVPPLNAVS